MELWNNLEGSVIEGRYPLRKLVRSEGRCAWFETESGGKPAILSLTESLNDQEEMLARLRAAAQLRHPDVVAIEQTGVATIHNEPLVYAITEYTEENLADVLRDRALSKEEARQTLDGMLAGLTAIHAKKLVHTRMEAASVLAVGETVKLRSDCIQQPANDAAFSQLAAADVRGLGATLFLALTQRQPQSANDPAILRLPAPFSQVVRRALSGQATTAEIAALLQPESKPPSAAAPVPAAPAKADKPLSAAAAAYAAASLAGDEPKARKNGPYIIVALVVVLLIVAWLLHAALRSQHRPIVSKATPAAAANQPVTTAPVAAPVAAAPVSKPAPKVAANTPRSQQLIWRVVAYTYNRQDQAQHKADEINQRYPDLHALAFSPHAGGRWLVTLGGGPMDRSQAIQLRLKALKMGLARDTYVRNYRK